MDNNLTAYEKDNKEFANYLLEQYFFQPFRQGRKETQIRGAQTAPEGVP